MSTSNQAEQTVRVAAGQVQLEGSLSVPEGAHGTVLFAHGSGSSRHSTRNRAVARFLQDHRLGTLLLDLLTAEEESVDQYSRHLRFDIPMLAQRLVHAIEWLQDQPRTTTLPIGLFGASTGAGAALIAAAQMPDAVGAVVSRGGRPDLAGDALRRVAAPTLLIVGGLDEPVIELNQQAYQQIYARKELAIVPGATHLFEEPGALEAVARLAADWFTQHLGHASVGAANRRGRA